MALSNNPNQAEVVKTIKDLESNKQNNLPTTSTAGKVLKSTSTAGVVEWGDESGGGGGSNVTLTTTTGSEAITVESNSLTLATRDTDQNITGTKTFVGQQKVKFKQSSSSDKLGFTLYNSSNKEISSLQYSSRSMRPIGSGSSTSYDLLALQNYTGDASNYHATQVGMRSMSDDTSSQKAFNFLVPKDTKANMNAVYGSDYDTIYLNTAITDGTNTVFADKKGVANISNVLGSLATPNLTDSTAHTQTGHATVVESYLSSNKQVWYRLWSDGFKEQYYHWTGSSSEPQFAFPIAFSNTKYITVANASVDGYISAVRPQSQTVNSVSFRIGDGGTMRTATVLDIYCAGY